MEIEEVNVFLLEEMKKNIELVESGKEKTIELYHSTLSDIMNHLEANGFIDNEDMDTNGWQWDFWRTVRKNGTHYQLSGSGYYGNSITFNLYTD